MDSAFAKDLKGRLDKAHHQLQDVSAKRAAIQKEEVRLTNLINALQVLLHDEGQTSTFVPQRMTPPPKFESSLELAPLPKTEKSISQFIADFISMKNGTGTTHKEIAEALATDGYEHHRNYPYVVVSKLKDDGKVIEKEGKLLWKQGT